MVAQISIVHIFTTKINISPVTIAGVFEVFRLGFPLSIADIHMLWIGERLTKMERSCMKSFIQHGHNVFLHAYKNFDDLPDGVTRLDASEILEESKIFRHKSGSLAVFADFFRWKMLMRYPGAIWVDADVFCIKPFDFHSEYVIGGKYFEGELYTNNAVLKIPSDSQLLSKMYDLWENPHHALSFLPLKKARTIRALRLIGVQRHVSQYPFAISGPIGLRHYLIALEMFDKVKMNDPFEKYTGKALFTGEVSKQEVLDSDSYSVHFYQSVGDRDLVENVKAGSFFEWSLRSTGEI